MKVKLFVFLLGVSSCFLLPAARAQTDSLALVNDSLNTTILQEYQVKLAEIEKQRIGDSVRQAALERELRSLKTTDNLKKDELQKQLQSLKEKDSQRLLQKKAEIDSLRSNSKAFPVRGFFKDSLFLIYSKLGSFSAKDRAEAISNRIHVLSKNFQFDPNSLRLVPAETTLDIVSGETIIMSVSETDALWNNTTKDTLAAQYKAIIGAAVTNYQSETSFFTLAKEIGLALLTVLVFGLMIRYVSRAFRWTGVVIRKQKGKRIQELKIKGYTLLDSKKLVNAFLTINTVLKWGVMLLVVYIALPILFGFFPWTQNFAETLFGYFFNPLKRIASAFWDYLPNLFTIVVIVVLFRYLLKAIRYLKTEIERGALQISGFYPDWAGSTYQIVRALVVAFMVVVIFPYLPGSDSPIFKGVSVFLGFLFTFGSAGSLSNVIAGIVLTYMRLFKIGDIVKIGEVIGAVIEKSLLVTRIRTNKNEIISIPNSTVMNSHTINYSSDAPDRGLIIYSTVTIGYDVPWRDMHEVLIEAALRTNYILPEPKPFVLQTSLDDFYVSYQVNAYTKEPNKQALIYSDLHQNIQDVCNETGIEIMSPHYRAQRDGSPSTIPAHYLSKDYSAPAFNTQQESDGYSAMV